MPQVKDYFRYLEEWKRTYTSQWAKPIEPSDDVSHKEMRDKLDLVKYA